MIETTSLHVIPFHPENYSRIYDYDSYIDQKSQYNHLFLDANKLIKTYGTQQKPSKKLQTPIKTIMDYPSIKYHQMQFDFNSFVLI